jgi:superfamily I DNA/RNA helicase
MAFINPEDWQPQGIAALEPAAMQAVTETARSVCVTASAGAGKTEFLAQKAAYLLQTGLCHAPYRILAISFKRDAAKNLAERVRERCPADMARRFDSLTFDAFTKTLIDRFGPAIPAPLTPSAAYQIGFPRVDDYRDFLQRNGQRNVNTKTLEKYISNTSLPVAAAGLDAGWRQLLDAWWIEAYGDPAATRLAFPMVNRLAEYLLRVRPHIAQALRMTYPFVFLDEFQDTTGAQYQLLQTAFSGSDAKLTAVGDDKQRIMGWAGAMPDGFARLAQDFLTLPVTLLSNWRSHEDLVSIQHVIAQRIDANTPPIQARAARNIAGDVSAIWTYPTRQAECEGVADWIVREIEDGVTEPHEIALLVRMYANRVEEEFGPVFSARGLSLRNVARQVGGVAIQDILTEELSRMVLPLLRLGASAKAPEAWQDAASILRNLQGIEDEDERGGEMIRAQLETAVQQLCAAMTAAPTEASCDTIVALALAVLDETALRRSVLAYGRDIDYGRIKTGFLGLLKECSQGAPNWTAVLDRFIGVGQVPLMTIHKSKGLEFHTMIFLGLDGASWRYFRPDSEEELKAFFVAFTRAMQRAFFTRCAERGRSIAWLEQLLLPAGVATLEGPG